LAAAAREFDAQDKKTSMQQSHAESRYLSPKSTFFFGAEAAAIGVFSASTTGAAILK
jgi:hypothetical protein